MILRTSFAETAAWSGWLVSPKISARAICPSIESDSILIVDPAGNRISGKAQHEGALSAWFGAEDPKWNMYWAMPYKGVSGGDDWIIAGHEVTTTVDGKIVKQNHMIDAKINNRKVELFYVYSMDIPTE